MAMRCGDLVLWRVLLLLFALEATVAFHARLPKHYFKQATLSKKTGSTVFVVIDDGDDFAGITSLGDDVDCEEDGKRLAHEFYEELQRRNDEYWKLEGDVALDKSKTRSGKTRPGWTTASSPGFFGRGGGASVYSFPTTPPPMMTGSSSPGVLSSSQGTSEFTFADTVEALGGIQSIIALLLICISFGLRWALFDAVAAGDAYGASLDVADSVEALGDAVEATMYL